MDRCNPEKAVALLEQIKLVLDLPSTIFVLALNEKTLDGFIRKRYELHGIEDFTINEYIEKLIQLRYHIAPITPSDRGSQYASYAYQELLRKYRMRGSMSRKGDCWDNAPMESFYHTLKTERIHHRNYQTRAQARAEIIEWIEMFYNGERLHSALGYTNPAEFERISLAKVA